jgi:glutathione S-transferase
MAEIQIFGAGGASYPWSARLACEEKGVPHEFVQSDFRSEAYRTEHHPYNKMPAMAHGDVALFETTAILRYIDAAFDGPALEPADAFGRARMEQVVSAYKAYMYEDFVPAYLLKYLFAKDGVVDRAAVDAALPTVEKHLGVLDDLHTGSPWFVGDSPTLADLVAGPVLVYLDLKTPEGHDMIRARRKLADLVDALFARASLQATLPPPLKAHALAAQ